jgi:glycine dehydrogenase subunit 1
MTEVAEQCLERAHHAAEELSKLDGFQVAFSAPFFHEFVLTCPRPAEEVVRGAMKLGVIPGVPLSRFSDLDIRSKENQLLVCVTEKHLENDLRALVEAVKEGGRG